MKKELPMLIALLFFSDSGIFAQQWIVTPNGNGDEVITAMALDNNGNVYVTRYDYNANGESDYLTVKYNTSGVRQWQKRYNGPGSGDDKPRAISVDDGGNVYVTGISDAYPGYAIDNDVATVKYSSQGSLLWTARYDGNIVREDAGNAIKVDASGWWG